MADEGSPVYEARFGWDRKTAWTVALTAVFTACLLLPDIPLYARLLGLPLFGGGGLFMAYSAMSHKVALRVDETGVLLGGNPARYESTTAQVPWEDIAAVVLWRQHSAASIPYVGLALHRHAALPPGSSQGRVARATLRMLVPHLPADVVPASRPVSGWRLDKDRLTAAVAHFAPTIPVVDAG
ncbi:hypothetical protein [Streptomyces sp. AK02-01A]|uniref:hypothetical protein n=1 Tax=Streptomyces sp. AK02-01A TaxID=3028648 RepID=UPI0029A9A7E4|nr:hypothetical protein [Streptomyces sp. AK02-01A]MDX3850366.1 hypothetical protein [Streptomyces sp. AK02-01A]